METSNISANDDRKNGVKSGFPNPDKNLFWKLYLGRKGALGAMKNDVDELVNQCLAAKRHLQSTEDSNRNLRQEVRSLRSKYEALLEKNRKDTGIIMQLKDSEALLKRAAKTQKTTNESLLEVQLINKEKNLDRKLLEDDRDKLVFRSQAVTNVFRKKNIRHKYLYQLILDEDKKYKDNDRQFIEETQQLKYILGKNDGILAKWLKDDAERDAAIRRLQRDMKEGLKISLENDEKVDTDEAASDEVYRSPEKAAIPQSNENKSSERSSSTVNTKSSTGEKVETEEEENREKAFEKEWLSKKTLFEAAEKAKEHLIEFYMILNKRMQDLSIEAVNVREWLLDKEAEKKDIWEKASAMEKLVSEKRRQKPVPLRTSTDEMKIWIDVQQQANDALRKIVYECLSVKLEDSRMYSEFVETIRNMYLNTLKEQLAREQDKKKEEPTQKPNEEKT